MSAADRLELAAAFPRCTDRLNLMKAEELDACLQAMLRPVYVPGIPGTPPLLATLPLAAQANLLLLLKAVPRRFTAAQQAAVLDGLRCLPGAESPTLLGILAADVEAGSCEQAAGIAGPPPLPCPAFLLQTATPCFPGAASLSGGAEAGLPAKQRSTAAHLQPAAGDKRAAEARGGGGSHSKRPCLASAAAEPAAPPAEAADAELAAAVAVVRTALGGGGGGATQGALLPEARAALEVVLARAAACGPQPLQLAGLDRLDGDALLLQLLTEALSPTSSFALCSAACGGVLLPRLRRLDAPAPRDLAAAVEHLGSCNPRAFAAACLGPLLGCPGLNKHQAELLSGAVKGCLPPQLLPDALQAACLLLTPAETVTAGAAGGARPGAGSIWNEHTLAVLQAVLGAKPPLNEAGVGQLAAALLGAVAGSPAMAASVKLAKLALSVVKQYPGEAAASRQLLQALAQACASFMAKPLAAAVAKL